MKTILAEKFGKPIHKIFFIGIGGSSLSGLALMAQSQGFAVEGSDMTPSPFTEKLKAADIFVHFGHDKKNIPQDTDMVVYSAAIHEDNPDYMRAVEMDLPLVERSDYLGLLSLDFAKTIGVAGTHGKTTTSSLLAAMLYHAGLDPSVSIGGSFDEIGGNANLGQSDYFVIESCEFVDSFLKTKHYIGIITNIEEDHLEYFKGGLAQIKDSFRKFAKIVPPGGLIIAWGDSPDVMDVTAGLETQVTTYGLDEKNDWVAGNITYADDGTPTFDVYHHGEYFGRFTIQLPGEHNVLNAMSAIACGAFLGLSAAEMAPGLAAFHGAKRRFQSWGQVGGINIYEDYAHHPTEVKVVVQACLNHKHNKLWVVFQPHSYSRLKLLFNEFIDAFQGADEIVLNDVYSDREKVADWDIYSEDLAKRIKTEHQIPTVVISDFDRLVKYVADNAAPGDLVLVAGAGNISKAAPLLVDELKGRYEQ